MHICCRQEACEVDLSQVAACIFSCPQHRSKHRCWINVAFSTTSGKPVLHLRQPGRMPGCPQQQAQRSHGRARRGCRCAAQPCESAAAPCCSSASPASAAHSARSGNISESARAVTADPVTTSAGRHCVFMLRNLSQDTALA